MAVIGALAGVIGTLASAVALLYRAQVKALTDQLSRSDHYLEDRIKTAEFWRDKYLEADSRVDKALEPLGEAVAIVKTVHPSSARRGPGTRSGN